MSETMARANWDLSGGADRKVNVFLYGSYMSHIVLAAFGVRLDPPVSCVLRGYRLMLDPIARIEPADGARVLGIICRLSHRELERLYASDWMKPYLVEPVSIEGLDGTWAAPALTYTPTRVPTSTERPPRYVESLVATAEALGFPEDYLEELRSWISPGGSQR